MISGFDQNRWVRIGGAVVVALLFSVLLKPALTTLAAPAGGTGSAPSTTLHANNVLRRDRVATQGEHRQAAAVGRAAMEDTRAFYELSEPKRTFSVIGFGFICFSLLLLLTSLLSGSESRRLRGFIASDQCVSRSLVLTTLRLRI